MKRSHKQSGAVLLIGLVMVMVLSIIAAAAVQTTLMQQKMTTNMRDKELSFQGAESALRAAEAYLDKTAVETLNSAFDNTNGLYQYDANRNLAEIQNWDDLSVVETANAHQVVGKPVYLIEELPPINAVGNSLQLGKTKQSHYYRVTSKSKGGTQSALSILQSTYKK